MQVSDGKKRPVGGSALFPDSRQKALCYDARAFVAAVRGRLYLLQKGERTEEALAKAVSANETALKYAEELMQTISAAERAKAQPHEG